MKVKVFMVSFKPFLSLRQQTLMVLLICLLFGYSGCEGSKELAPKEVLDYIHIPHVHPTFEKADRFKYDVDYVPALETFTTIWHGTQLRNKEDSMYCLNQIAYLNLCMYKDSVAHIWIQKADAMMAQYGDTMSPGARGDYWYNKGRYAYNIGDVESIFKYFFLSKDVYAQVYECNSHAHLRFFFSIYYLALSFNEYADTEDYKQYVSMLQPYREQAFIEKYREYYLYLISFSFLYKRDHQTGLSTCETAIQLTKNRKYVDSILLINCKSQLGQMYKKMAEHEYTTVELRTQYINMAKLVLTEALQISERVNHSLALAPYNNIIYLYTLDTTAISIPLELFIFKEQKLVEKFGSRILNPGIHRAYLYYKKYLKLDMVDSDVEKLKISDGIYRAYIQKNRRSKWVNRANLEQALFARIRLQEKLGNYGKALTCLADAIAYGSPIIGSLKSPTIKDLLSCKEITSDVRLCSFFAQAGRILLHKFMINQDAQSLLQSYEFLTLSENLFFSKLSSIHSDAALTQFKEISEEENLCGNGIKVCKLLYRKTGREEYASRALRFLEHGKYFLLHRDMLKSTGVVNIDALNKRIYKTSRNINKLKWERSETNKITVDSSILSLSNQLSTYQDSLDFIKEKKSNDNIIIDSINIISKCLRRGECFIHYYLSENDLFFWAITFDGAFLFKNVKVGDSFERSLEDLGREGYQKGKSMSYFDTLYRVLYKPICRYLEGKRIERLIISPDKNIAFVPFDLLQEMGNPKSILVDKYIITLTPSWSIYSENSKVVFEWKEESMLFVTQRDERMTETKRLIYLASQTLWKSRFRLIDQHFSQVEDGISGTPKEKIWHFAVHGFSTTTNSFENYLVLNRDTLYGFELFEIDNLPKLLVFSSCETSWGKNEKGEGVYSFTRACLEAGVPHVISTLWEVDETKVSKILSELYSNMQHSNDLALLLTTAKRTYLNRENTNSIDWAALVYWI